MANYIEGKEREYQNRTVKLFCEQLGYTYLGNLQYAKDTNVNPNGVPNSPIIESELKAYLKDAGYTQMQIEGAWIRLKMNSYLSDKKFTSLMMVNNFVYGDLMSGAALSPSPEENEKDVMFFDFKNIEKNRFAIAEEVSYIDTKTGGHSRPDIVVYVNGIALAVIELKRSTVSLEEGIKQHLSNERDLIPSFFTTTQFTVVARPAEHKEMESGEKIEDGLYGFKYATIGTPMRYWCPWKKDTNKTGVVLSDTESFEDFFNKENFMFLFRYGVLSDGGVKKVMRPHQYHALRAAEPRLRDKASGVIWHSQGSGKSLTMVWLASYIRANFENPRVLVITDRTELDAQLSRDFTDTGNNLHRATSQDDLLQTLNGGEDWLITTLIHKFGRHDTAENENADRRTVKVPLDKYIEGLLAIINDKNKYPNGFSVKGNNIFIFIDECHRTQGGRLHEAMKAIMGQDVMLIGFTGTPLLKEEKKNGYDAFRNMSEVRFGPFIHKYLNKQAVEDKVILDLQYEAREVEQSITSKEKLEEKLQEITKGLSKDRKKSVEDRWATLERVYSSSDRIERIGYSILDDMEHNSILRQDWANAMLVAGNIYSAYKYYDFFQNKCSDKCLHGRVAVVTSYEPTDNDERKNTFDVNKETEEKFKHDMAINAFNDAEVDNVGKYEEWAKDMFVHQPGLMKLIIVVDKLLTGFDAPCATFLYIDKDMRDHNLFQSICRVNRLGSDVYDEDGVTIKCRTHKEFGLIVDFKQLFGKIEEAVTRFNDESGGFGGLDSSDIEGLLEDNIAKNKKRLEAAVKAFEGLKGVWQSKNLTNNDLLADYYTTDCDDDPAVARRENLYSITGAMTSSYDNLADMMPRAGFTPEEADKIEFMAKEAATINLYVKQKSGDMFDPRNYDPDMRTLLDRYLRAEDAETIVPANADFSFLDLIDDKGNAERTISETVKKSGGSEKAAADVIAAKARAVINDAKTSDPALYATFSERLQHILDELHKSQATYKERMKQLLQLIKEAKNGGSEFPEGIDTPLKKALWNNRGSCGFTDDATYGTHLINRIVHMNAEDAPPDYRDPSSADAIIFKKRLRKNNPELTEEQLNNVYHILIRN